MPRAKDDPECGATLDATDALGRPFLLRCYLSAWHTRKHRAAICAGSYTRWEGRGRLREERGGGKPLPSY